MLVTGGAGGAEGFPTWGHFRPGNSLLLWMLNHGACSFAAKLTPTAFYTFMDFTCVHVLHLPAALVRQKPACRCDFALGC